MLIRIVQNSVSIYRQATRPGGMTAKGLVRAVSCCIFDLILKAKE
jgi:hypothetical protein